MVRQFLCRIWSYFIQEMYVFVCVKRSHGFRSCATCSLLKNVTKVILKAQDNLTRTSIFGNISYTVTNSWVIRMRSGFIGWPWPYEYDPMSAGGLHVRVHLEYVSATYDHNSRKRVVETLRCRQWGSLKLVAIGTTQGRTLDERSYNDLYYILRIWVKPCRV